MEKWQEQTTVFEGPIFRVVTGSAEIDTGELVRRDVVDHDGGVAVVAVHEGKVLLVKQFRIAAGKALLELPAGRREGQEDPAFRAGQELEEEVGYRAGKLTPLSSYFSSAGFTSERMHLFVATELTPVARRPEFDERIEVVAVPVEEIPALVGGGELEDAKTMIGLLLYWQQTQAGGDDAATEY